MLTDSARRLYGRARDGARVCIPDGALEDRKTCARGVEFLRLRCRCVAKLSSKRSEWGTEGCGEVVGRDAAVVSHSREAHEGSEISGGDIEVTGGSDIASLIDSGSGCRAA